MKMHNNAGHLCVIERRTKRYGIEPSQLTLQAPKTTKIKLINFDQRGQKLQRFLELRHLMGLNLQGKCGSIAGNDVAVSIKDLAARRLNGQQGDTIFF